MTNEHVFESINTSSLDDVCGGVEHRSHVQIWGDYAACLAKARSGTGGVTEAFCNAQLEYDRSRSTDPRDRPTWPPTFP
jgi:hypothetical protein